jgi:uncharacterized protein YciI
MDSKRCWKASGASRDEHVRLPPDRAAPDIRARHERRRARDHGRHAAHWQRYLDAGQMVVFGPFLTDEGSYGLGVVEISDDAEDKLRAFAANDPVVTTGTARIEVAKMIAGFVRPTAPA